MPSNVRNFFWLNSLSLILGLIITALTTSKTTQIASTVGQGPVYIITIQAIVLAFCFLIIWLTAFKRKNWARWLWLVLFVLGVAPYVAIFKNLFGISLAGAISLFQGGLQLVALYFVFTGNAKPWFRQATEDQPA